MRSRIAAAGLSALLLAGCGGGGTPAQSTDPTSVTATSTAPATTPEPTITLTEEEVDTEAAIARTSEYVTLYWELVGDSWQDAAGRSEILAMTAPEWTPFLQLEIDNYLYDKYTASGTATVDNIRATGYQTTETGTYIDVTMCQDPTAISINYDGAPAEGVTMVRREVVYRLRIMPEDTDREPLVQSITAGGEC